MYGEPATVSDMSHQAPLRAISGYAPAVTPFGGKVKVTRSSNAVTVSQPCLRKGKATNFILSKRTEYDDLHHYMHGDLQTESSGWLFKSPLAGGGGIL